VTDSLIRAAKRGDLVALREAIRPDTNLNVTDSQGWTPLFHAAHQGSIEALKLLIQAGADVNHGKETGFTALFSAVMSGHVEAVHILLNAGAEIIPVQGIELRGYSIRTDSPQHEVILRMLDEHREKQKSSQTDSS
jgi:ankyrin repeat protein